MKGIMDEVTDDKILYLHVNYVVEERFMRVCYVK